MRKFSLSMIFLAAASAVPLFAQLSFFGPDVNATNEVLFGAVTTVPGDGEYKTLFRKNLDTGALEQLTCYPESLESLSDGFVLQIRNRFGAGRYDTRTSAFSWLEDPKPFQAGGIVARGLLPDFSASPNGRWIVSIDPVSSARGRLVMYDTDKRFRRVLSESVPRGPIPVSWAPDSSVMLYALDGTLYFARPESFFSVSTVDEKYRVLGPGSVNSVSWYSDTRFLYVSGASVYRVQSSELFARSLYAPLMGPGELAGKIPCDFDPDFDDFQSDPDGSALLYAKDGRNVYYCPLVGDDYVFANRADPLPYLLLPGNTAAVSFSWSPSGKPAVLADSVEDGKKTVKAWKLDDILGAKIFTQVSVPSGVSAYKPAPDGSLIAFVTTQGISVLSTSTWKEAATWKTEPVESIAWRDSSSMFVGGKETVRSWNVRSGSSSVLFLSSVTAFAWDEREKSILGDTASLGRFSYDGSMRWSPLAAGKIRPASATNGSYRLYTDTGAGYYANMLYARAATTPGGTSPFFAEPAVSLPKAFPFDGPSESNGIFAHGSRTGLKQVALTFDAMDGLDGLPETLRTLANYGIRATFFINGEFIRQHPAAVNEIVKAGHQCASLFFTTWDLSGTAYRIDEDFITRGLARNEDDFYNATGQELTLLWHAPYYVASPLIVAAGKKAGYRYVSGDVTVMDWVTEAQGRSIPGLYRESSAILEGIMNSARSGSIIPVTLGKRDAGRSDYLFDRVDLLVNALVEAGYEIVTVDTLVNNLSK